MFELYKPRYLTKGIEETIPQELQAFLWEAVDRMPEPKDYLQVFQLSTADGLQIIEHSSEVPEFKMMYILTEAEEAVAAKIYIIDSNEYCTMLLAEEY